MHSRYRSPQHGMALVIALLVTTLAVTVVASLFWMQQVQVRAMENQRLHLQAQWALRAGLDLARAALRQDGAASPTVTTLDGLWNTPMAELPLDDYIERERVAGERYEAGMAGRIVDAQSRLNLANLATAGTVNEAELRAFRRLLINLKLDPALARRTAEAIAGSQQADGAPAGVLRRIAPTQLNELLAVAGYSAPVLAALADYVVLLPEAAALNVDTAAPEVLAAVFDSSVPEVLPLAARRRQAYFRTIEEFGAALRQARPIAGVRIGLKSDYFLVRHRVRLDRATLETESLIHRQGDGRAATTVLWTRQQ
jgi:general secretion pathway protein K